MDKQDRRDNDIRYAIDAQFSGVVVKPDLQRRVLQQVRGEVKVKKRISLGLVVALVIIFTVLTALAATLLWENYVVGLRQTEQDKGKYQDWKIGDKQTLVKDLMDMDQIEESDTTTRLFDESTSESEKNALADQIMIELLKKDANTKEIVETDGVLAIDSTSITYAVMGFEDWWTPEQRVWWQKVTNPHVESSGEMVLVLPEVKDISEKEAIAIAKRAIIDTFGMLENELDEAHPVANMYVSEERPEYKRWLVEFQLFKKGSKSYVERWYEAIIDSSGNLIVDSDFDYDILEASAAEMMAWAAEDEGELPPIIEAYCEYAEYEESYLVREWSLEAKAEYSAELRPQVLEVLESGDFTPLINSYRRFLVPNREIIASTTFAYGLPTDNDIKEDDALDLARLYIWNAYGLDGQSSKQDYSYYEYFDVTDSDRPLWRFIFFPDSFEGLGCVPVYRVELDAQSGAKVSLTSYVWQEIFNESAYNSKWY